MKKHFAIAIILALAFLLLSGCSVIKDTSNGYEDIGAKDVVLEKIDEQDETKANDLLPMYSSTQLYEDFKQFEDIINNQHPKMSTDRNELENLFEVQHSLIKDNMTEIEFYRILSPIIAKLNCGHTRVVGFSQELEDYKNTQGKYLPLSIKIIDNKAFVHQVFVPSDIPEGAEIMTINNNEIDDIIQTFLENISSDGENTTMKYYVINNYFNYLYFDLFESPEEFFIAYTTNGEILSTNLEAVTKDQLDAVLQADSFEDRLYFNEFNEDYAILTIKSFAFYDRDSCNAFMTFIDEFFDTLQNMNTNHLILDLRDNWGGDPNCTAHLFSYLIDEAVPYFSENAGSYYTKLKQPVVPAENHFKGELYILINGASFSSTGHLSALLKYHEIGSFFGEESGGTFICTDSSKNTILNNTKIQLCYSTAPWEVAVSGFTPGRGIVPDYIVEPTISDYLNNIDLVMEFVIDFIEKTEQ